MLGTHLSGRSARGQIRLAEPGVARRWAWRPTAGGFSDAEKPRSKRLGTFLGTATLLVAACTSGGSRVAVRSDVFARPDPDSLAFDAPSQALPDLSKIHVELQQAPSPREVVVWVTLRNDGPNPTKITMNPRFDSRRFDDDRDAEVLVQVEDARGRLLIDRCIRFMGKPFDAKIRELPPRGSARFSYQLADGCYDLVPGETLSFGATYANLFAPKLRHTASQKLPVARAQGWIKVLVPDTLPVRR
jgi:hypothetical protein